MDHEDSCFTYVYTQLYEGARGEGQPPPDPAVQPTIRAGLLKNIARAYSYSCSCQLSVVSLSLSFGHFIRAQGGVSW